MCGPEGGGNGTELLGSCQARGEWAMEGDYDGRGGFVLPLVWAGELSQYLVDDGAVVVDNKLVGSCGEVGVCGHAMDDGVDVWGVNSDGHGAWDKVEVLAQFCYEGNSFSSFTDRQDKVLSVVSDGANASKS